MSTTSVAPDRAPPCVIIVDRSASVVEALAGRLGAGRVRIIAVRTALETLRHLELEPAASILIGSVLGLPDGDGLARVIARRFPAVAVDRIQLEPPLPQVQLD